MELSNIVAVVSMVGAIAGAVIFIISKIISKVKHEDSQDAFIKTLVDNVEKLSEEVEKLKNRDGDRELIIVQVQEKMESLIQAHETTQTMISNLTENQQETSMELLKTIQSLLKTEGEHDNDIANRS